VVVSDDGVFYTYINVGRSHPTHPPDRHGVLYTSINIGATLGGSVVGRVLGWASKPLLNVLYTYANVEEP
jgi:hypothetical protein